MFNYKETLQAMRGARASMQAELDKLDQAISALEAVVDKTAPTKTKRKLSQAQKKRRAKVKEGANANEKKPRTRSKISAQGLRNIVAAQKRRWSKVRAEAAKATVKSSSGK